MVSLGLELRRLSHSNMELPETIICRSTLCKPDYRQDPLVEVMILQEGGLVLSIRDDTCVVPHLLFNDAWFYDGCYINKPLKSAENVKFYP